MRLGWGLLGGGLLAAGFAVYRLTFHVAKLPAAPPRPPYMLPVTLADVTRADLAPRSRLTGSVRSARAVSAAFEIAGRIYTLDANEGDEVEAGAVLAKLDGADQRLAHASASASLTLAEKRLAKLEAGTRAEEITRLEAELEAAHAAGELARLDVVRARTLRADAVGSQAELDRSESQDRAAVAREKAVRASLDEAVAGTRVEDLEVARAEVAVARAAQARIMSDVSKTQLTAPWKGLLTKRLRSTGDSVDRGEAVFELVDVDQREIEVEIPSRLAPSVARGAEVVIELDERPGVQLRGQLDVVVAAADETSRNFRGLVRVDARLDPAHVLKPGMFVRLDIALAPIPDALLVPYDAVRLVDQGTIVVRAKAATPGAAGGHAAPFTAEWVPVRVLAADGRTRAIECLGAPLLAGDQVVVTGLDVAFPGAPLLPRADAPSAAPAAAKPK